MVAPIKGYSADVESQSIDPNGGINKFQDEQTVQCPDKILVKRKVLRAHNSDAVGQIVTIVVDGKWLFTETDKAPLTAEQKSMYEKMVVDAPENRNRTKEEKDRLIAEMLSRAQQPSYVKVDLKAVEEAGGPSVRDYVALTGNLAAPLTPYKLDTLKLENETRDEWVLLAEIKQEGAPWSHNRLTIDRKTGFLKTVEAIVPVPDEPLILLRVKNVSPKAQIEVSLFKMELPAPISPGSPYVMDYTSMWLDQLKMQRTSAGEEGKSKSPPR